MSKLKAVEPKSAEPSKPKVLIYGKPGVGKTWTALDFPSVFYMDTEGGADLDHYTDKLKAAGGVYLGPDQGSLDFKVVLEQVQALATEKHHFRTLVIDSITKLFNVAVADEAERLGDKDAFGASKKPAVSYMRRLLSWLTRLDMNVLLIAHEKELWGLSDKGQREVVGATFDCWDKLEYELHLALHIVKLGPRRIAKVRKSRLMGFPDADTLDWSYPAFAERYGRDVMEKGSRPVVLASEGQLTELKRLLEVVKLPEGQEEKWLNAAGVSAWHEMEADRIGKCIVTLRNRIPNSEI